MAYKRFPPRRPLNRYPVRSHGSRRTAAKLLRVGRYVGWHEFLAIGAIQEMLNYGGEAVSVAFEEVTPEDWAEKVYRPDIQGKWDTVYRKPGYNPFQK